MGTPAAEEATLDEIRKEIDAIDDRLLALLERRFEAVGRVAAAKSLNGGVAGSPIRPARESAILRRLLNRAESPVPAELTVRLWRAMISAATQSQAQLTIHVGKRLNSSIGLRLRIRDYLGTMPVEEWRDEAQALMQVNAGTSDLCVVETESPWVEAFVQGKAGQAQIIGVLPVLRENIQPKLLIFGHAHVELTGNDETIIVSDGNLPRDFTPPPLWQVKAGTRRISCLPGFHSEHESPLVGLMRSNATLGLKVAGRYPSPIEVGS
ncbi:MAG: chorismate mutase [Hyphomicrobiales bacterium]